MSNAPGPSPASVAAPGSGTPAPLPAGLPLLPFRDGVTTWADARNAGLGSTRLAQLLRQQLLWRPVRATLAQGVEPEQWWDAYAIQCRAALLRWGEHTIAHESALMMRGLPLLGRPREVHLAHPRHQAIRQRRGVLLHPMRGERELVIPPGCGTPWPVMSVVEALSGVALLPDTSLERVLVPLDAALRRQLVTRDDLAEWGQAGARRIAVLRQALEWADPRSESPGETCTRVELRRLGFDVVPQVEISTHLGDKRVDLALEQLKVVVEFDGMVKYEGVNGPEALMAEKRREDAIRAAGYAVVRVVWPDLRTVETVGRLRAHILDVSPVAGRLHRA